MGAADIPNYENNPFNGADFPLLSLNVVGPSANPVTTIPTSLVTVTPWDENDVDVSANFLQAGAHDYLSTASDISGLKQIINRIKSKTAKSVKKSFDFFADELAGSVSMVGQSQAALPILRMIVSS